MSSNRPSRKLSRLIAERAQWHCEYCHSPAAFSTQPFEIDHIIPLSKNGLTVLENLAFSCGLQQLQRGQNARARPEDGPPRPALPSAATAMEAAFSWSADFLRIVGRTATGRATVDTLQLNRVELLNLRRLLRAAGEYPPSLA